MTENVRATAEKIRKLQVQGARNTAIEAIKAIQTLAEQTKAKTKKEFLNELFQAQNVLFASRETEPLMRNAVRWIINQVQDSREQDVKLLCKNVSLNAEQFLKNLENSRELIAQTGSKRIREGYVVFTHCHSSTVTRMLAIAKKEGKNFRVICTETRPAFQGRITAKEVVGLGVKTTFIVDSAARSYMNNADIVMVGADAITAEGNVVNKIGTSTLAVLAKEARKPFYVVSELLKFDPTTLYGDYEKIEMRNPKEVWEDAPEKLQVCNPAFDVTRRDFIHGIICEEGVIAPASVTETARRLYPWLFSKE